jgi:hypothetical protein
MASTRSKGKPIVEELHSNKLRKNAKRKFMSPAKMMLFAKLKTKLKY